MGPKTYAVTTVVHGRRRLFQSSTHAELLIATLFRYRDQSRFLLHGFVVMPEHVHVLLTPAETIERAVQMIKGGYSFAARKQYAGEIWQAGYHAHRITSPEDYRSQFSYIAANPEKRRLANYPYVHTAYCEQLDAPPSFCLGEAVPQGLKPPHHFVPSCRD